MIRMRKVKRNARYRSTLIASPSHHQTQRTITKFQTFLVVLYTFFCFFFCDFSDEAIAAIAMLNPITPQALLAHFVRLIEHALTVVCNNKNAIFFFDKMFDIF